MNDVLIVMLICPKANDLAVSNAKLLITATAIVKSPIGRLGIRRIALGSSRRGRGLPMERTDVTINKNDAQCICDICILSLLLFPKGIADSKKSHINPLFQALQSIAADLSSSGAHGNESSVMFRAPS